MGKISQIPIHSRPREKAYRYGIKSLSDVELLAIIIQSGTKKYSALDISNMLIDKFKGVSNVLSSNEYSLMKFEGISKVKATQILAIKELFVRYSNDSFINNTLIFNSILDVYNYVNIKINNKTQEILLVLYLNQKNKLIYEEISSIGDEKSAIVNIKLICKTTIEKYASKVIIIHNHPSGNTTPSKEDINSFTMLKDGLSLIGCKLLDSIILGLNSFYSIANMSEYKVNQ